MPERYFSPALRSFAPLALDTAPLAGVEGRIYNAIWRGIATGKLKPGTKLREDVIGETFEISRTVIRKVLFIMEQEGFVSLPPNRGAYVATPTPEATIQGLEMHQMLTSFLLRQLAAPNSALSDPAVKLIEQHIAAEADASAVGDLGHMRVLVGEFYTLLAAIYGNRMLIRIAAGIPIRGVLGAILYQTRPTGIDWSAKHREFLEHLAAHDAEGAVAAFEAAMYKIKRSLRFETEPEEVDLAAILRG